MLKWIHILRYNIFDGYRLTVLSDIRTLPLPTLYLQSMEERKEKLTQYILTMLQLRSLSMKENTLFL